MVSHCERAINIYIEINTTLLVCECMRLCERQFHCTLNFFHFYKHTLVIQLMPRDHTQQNPTRATLLTVVGCWCRQYTRAFHHFHQIKWNFLIQIIFYFTKKYDERNIKRARESGKGEIKKRSKMSTRGSELCCWCMWESHWWNSFYLEHK